MRVHGWNGSTVLRPVRRVRKTALRRGLVARKGFTLPELIVSMMIMSVGILALATGSAGVLRQIRAGNQSTLAAAVATSRLETMRSQTCSALFSGSATTRGLAESWAVTSVSARWANVVVQVNYTLRAGKTSTLQVNSVMPCK
jgi:prepilin-type N-terminal cleavage/methylation domain-containing protein